jgi:hypothetical protein
MAETFIDDLPEGVTWHQFLKVYREEYKCSHMAAMEAASPLWVRYKELHNIISKANAIKLEDNTVKRSDIPRTKLGGRKKNVSVRAPPKGKRMVIRYEDDSESEDEVEVVKKTKVKLVKKKPVVEKAHKKVVKKPAPKKTPKKVIKKKRAEEEQSSESESEEEESEDSDLEEGSE